MKGKKLSLESPKKPKLLYVEDLNLDPRFLTWIPFKPKKAYVSKGKNQLTSTY
jgi:hypothetical protein